MSIDLNLCVLEQASLNEARAPGEGARAFFYACDFPINTTPLPARVSRSMRSKFLDRAAR